MTEEHTTEVRDPEGNTHRHTTVVTDEGHGSGGSFKWIVLIVLVVALVVIGYVMMQGAGAEAAKDNAIADAAGQAGDAAQQVGDSVEAVADEVTGGE